MTWEVSVAVRHDLRFAVSGLYPRHDVERSEAINQYPTVNRWRECAGFSSSFANAMA